MPGDRHVMPASGQIRKFQVDHENAVLSDVFLGFGKGIKHLLSY
jgi:hypothetical protein